MYPVGNHYQPPAHQPRRNICSSVTKVIGLALLFFTSPLMAFQQTDNEKVMQFDRFANPPFGPTEWQRALMEAVQIPVEWDVRSLAVAQCIYSAYAAGYEPNAINASVEMTPDDQAIFLYDVVEDKVRKGEMEKATQYANKISEKTDRSRFYKALAKQLLAKVPPKYLSS